jgi:hypothetical protein
LGAQDIPQLPDGAITPQARQPLQRAQQELRRLLGYSGDILDMAVTYQALLNAGLITREALSNIRPGSGVPPRGINGGGTPGPAGPQGPGGGGGTPYEPDLTPPPNVTGLAAGAGITSVVVTWDVPAYSVGHGPGAVNLYVVLREPSDPLPTFGDANLFYSARPATLGIAALAIEANTRVHIWAKHVTVDGVESPDPAGGTNGVVVTTGQDVSHLLEVLNGSITLSQLHAALSAEIALISGSGAGSVNARIASEAATRESEDDAIAASVTTLSSTVAGNSAALAIEASTRATADGHLGSLYTVRAQVTQDGRTVVGGFGLSGSSGPGAGPTIDFGVLANRFWIGAPSGATGVAATQPFVVQTTDDVVNGVTIPRGVYMDAAYIKNLTALVARLGTAWIDNAMIASVSAAKIQTGTLWVGGRITGGAFTGWAWPAPGGTGFYLGPEGLLLGNHNDGAYFQVTAGGSVYAPGFSISGGSASFSGALSGATGTFSGNLSAAGGTFSGALSAATGHFAGTLDAASVTTGQFGTDRLGNLSVTTLKIQDEAVTVPRFYEAADQTSIGSSFVTVLSATPPAGGGFICTVSFNASPVSGGVDAYGEVQVISDGIPLAWSRFGVRATSGSAQYVMPVTATFVAAGGIALEVRIRAVANPGGSTINVRATEISMSIMSGKK